MSLIKHAILVLALVGYSLATNYTVKSGGGGNFTTIAACMTQMSTNGTGVSDTCTVFAGTYSETPTIPAGSSGNYKIVNVNGSDVVNVTGFVVSSHTQLVGNCAVPTAYGSCGFSIGSSGSATGVTCVRFASGATDVYIRGNSMQSCGTGAAMINVNGNGSVTQSYIQNNTMAYACTTVASPSSECNCILLEAGNHILIEGNDFSHYTLCVDQTISNVIMRNNTFHDQFETEAGGNGHTDIWFSEPGISTNVQFNVVEGNLQRNAHGADAKTALDQNDTGNVCGSLCNNLIFRYNTTSRIGGAINSNNGGSDWPFIKVYNNTNVDSASDINLSANGGGVNDNSQTATHATFLNNIYYLTSTQTGGGSSINMYACSTNCTAGYSDYFCTAGCATINGHTYGTCCWSSDTGNLNVNPTFVNYISAGNASNDYHLQATSSLIAVGSNLTTVNGTVSNSTSLVVTDASYFQDGYGLSNAYSTVSGDCIAVTTVGNHVCVTAVNYTTNTLTLASPISATNGDKVWLYSKSDGVVVLTGSAPDMGAFPFVAVTSTNSGGQGFAISNGSIH